MSGFGGIAAMFGGVALGGVGYELARAGDLGTGLQQIAAKLDGLLGTGVSGTTPGASGKPSTVDLVNASGATIYCKDGAKRVRTWAQIDADLAQAGNAMTSHDQAEALKYAQTCVGS